MGGTSRLRGRIATRPNRPADPDAVMIVRIRHDGRVGRNGSEAVDPDC